MRDERATEQQSRALGLRPALKLLFGLGALVTLGALALMLPGVATRPLGLSEAFFTAVSALTVTGLTVITPSQDLTTLGHVILMLLIQIGGVGYMVLAVTAFRMIGRRISLADRLALKDSLGLLNPGSIVELAKAVLKTVFILELIGAFLLWLNWRNLMPDGQAMFYGLFHSVSAFCNAGFNLFTGQPIFPEGLPRDDVTLVVMGILIFLGGLGIPVLFDFVTWPKTRHFSLHTKITVPLVLTLIAGGAIAVHIAERELGGVLAGETAWRSLMESFFQAVSGRTAGFVTMPDFGAISEASALVFGVLMFIGSAPASMGGGITTGTLAALILAMWAYSRGRETPVIKGRAIPGEMVRKAAAVLTISILVVVFATWIITLTHGSDLTPTAFEVISAFATCGLSLGLTDDLSLFGRIIIMLMMFWGRVGALTVFVTLARQRPARKVTYPEEKILIG